MVEASDLKSLPRDINSAECGPHGMRRKDLLVLPDIQTVMDDIGGFPPPQRHPDEDRNGVKKIELSSVHARNSISTMELCGRQRVKFDFGGLALSFMSETRRNVWRHDSLNFVSGWNSSEDTLCQSSG
ncbi:hypothetical protein CEXT_67951 [Caerostris extrusa]|uniref:Uncharacterized protein n=1 Tax=Caerostris extrusa TaxID=172846 RepID=A0AAV4VSS3_CAEEX|nr:hypothetical protein CEXT_67951 [Caerostris extrusa]